jgi:signal transduction histidine kinase/CheY-like chemotaxis protein
VIFLPAIFSVAIVLGAILAALAAALLRARRINAELRQALKAATESHKAQTSLLSKRASLDTIKDEFISTVSHELRTPLTSIRGALGLLSAGLMGTVDPKAQNLLWIAVNNTDRLIRLINDILDLERMESGRAPLQIRRCSLRELAQQGIETMTAMADAAQVHIELLPGSSDPEASFFDGDGDRILQVVTNLLSNAIKFSPPHTTICVHLSADANFVKLRVEDEGRGIPEEKLESIFDRFQQVEASDSRQKGGTGLGLAICRTIAQQHYGSIWAQRNHSGRGVSLCLELPRHMRTTDPQHGTLAELPMTEEGVVLVCDDDPGIRTVVAEHLRRHGYTVLEANRGEQAIQLAASHAVEAILLDLYMPGLSGWETLRQLKDSPATAGIPVVILSVLPPAGAAPGGSVVDRAQLAAAAQGWIQKPFHESLLLAELSRVLHIGEGPARVLLVEDDADLASVIIAGFADAFVRIEHTNTRQGAIEHCLTARPDLLILDLSLPDGDGFSLVDWLRRQPQLRSLPLVVYSGREVSDIEMEHLRLGPTQFLTKAKVQPREVEELVLTIVHRMRRPQKKVAANY